MKKTRLTSTLREMREGQTQDQLALDLNVSREAVSKWENGRAKIPADIAEAMMGRKENPWFALAIRSEYTKTGPMQLNGPNVDLHRSSVREKTIEEVSELLACLNKFSFAKPLKNLSDWEKPELHTLLEEAVEAITGLEHLVAVVCEEAEISYMETWQKHHQQLRAKGYIQ